MSPKARKPLDSNDDLANEFVFGSNPPLPPPDLKLQSIETPSIKMTDEPEQDEGDDPSPPKKRPTSSKAKQKSKPSLMSRLMPTTEKEATVRLTVDMPESMHRKLSILCAKTGKKKADIVRMLLGEALEEIED